MSSVEQRITVLEMTAADELVPAPPPPLPLTLARAGAGGAELVRTTHRAVGRPYGWSARPRWSRERWRRHLERPELAVWIARVGPRSAGMIEMERGVQEVEITIFGLRPEFIGRGLGGPLLTEGTRLAWGSRDRDGAAPRRVWLRTSSLDHPHAIHNYRSRGYRVLGIESSPRSLLDAAGRPS